MPGSSWLQRTAHTRASPLPPFLLQIGDTIDVKGPVGHYVYEGRGQFTNNRKPGSVKHISMIAGGTGGHCGCVGAWLLAAGCSCWPHVPVQVVHHGGQHT